MVGNFSSIEYAVSDGLAQVTLNLPDRGNPIDQTFCREIKELAVELSERADIRAVLLAAKGRYFSVGGDIKSLARGRSALPSNYQELDDGSSFCDCAIDADDGTSGRCGAGRRGRRKCFPSSFCRRCLRR
jgi:enoyl-CoA hydratase/carnithine racemase